MRMSFGDANKSVSIWARTIVMPARRTDRKCLVLTTPAPFINRHAVRCCPPRSENPEISPFAAANTRTEEIDHLAEATCVSCRRAVLTVHPYRMIRGTLEAWVARFPLSFSGAPTPRPSSLRTHARDAPEG